MCVCTCVCSKKTERKIHLNGLENLLQILVKVHRRLSTNMNEVI